jgi:hypothetical protein
MLIAMVVAVRQVLLRQLLQALVATGVRVLDDKAAVVVVLEGQLLALVVLAALVAFKAVVAVVAVHL